MTTLIAITDSLSILRKEQMIIRFVSCYSADNSWLLLTSRNISSSCAAWGLIHTGRQCRIRHGRPCRKDVRHSRDKNHPLSTKVNRVERIKFADNVERDKLSNPSLSPVCTDERQSRNDVTRDTLSFDTCSTSNKPATVDFRQKRDKLESQQPCRLSSWPTVSNSTLLPLFEWHCVSFSALAVFSRNALYKSTFYLLTYLLPVCINKNLSSAVAESGRRFVSLNILLSHSKSLKIIRNDTRR